MVINFYNICCTSVPVLWCFKIEKNRLCAVNPATRRQCVGMMGGDVSGNLDHKVS